MEEKRYVITLTLAALSWLSFFCWIVVFATTHYVEKIITPSRNETLQLNPIHESTMNQLIPQRISSNNMSSAKENTKQSIHATLGDYDPMDGDTSFQFDSPSWRVDALGVRETIRSNFLQSDIQERIDDLIEESNGYTKMIETESYGILTNVCINAKSKVLTLHFQDPSELGEITKKYQRSDFYFNDVRVLRTPLNPTKIVKTPLNLAIVHPANTELFRFFEGTSVLSFMTLHPELFPQIDHVLLFADPSKLTSYESFLLESYLTMFPTYPKPSLMYGTEPIFQQQALVCDRVVTVLRDWQREGPGSFFPSLLSVNQIRAQAYIYTHFYPVIEKSNKKTLLVFEHQRVRVIENAEEMVNTIQSSFPTLWCETMDPHRHLFEEIVTIMGKTDILLSVYSSDILYSLFMLPKSVVIEVFPPFWDEHEYGTFISNVGLQRILFRTNGEVAKACKKKPNSNDCWIRGMRDRNITVSLHDALIHVWNALSLVDKKY